MKRAVYIGGFANGDKTAQGVAKELEEYYSPVESFSFSWAMANPDKIHKATNNAHIITHSAGMLAVVQAKAQPKQLTSFSPPLPLGLLQYPAKTIAKRTRMHTHNIGITGTEDVAAIKAYEKSSAAELLRRPLGNFRHLGAISRFDAVSAAVDFVREGVPTTLSYTEGDEYFQLPKEREDLARIVGVKIVRMAGIHDELPIRPKATLELFYTDTLGMDL